MNQPDYFMYTMYCVSILSILLFHCIWSNFTCLVQGGIFYNGENTIFFTLCKLSNFCKGLFTLNVDVLLTFYCNFLFMFVPPNHQGQVVTLFDCSPYCMPEQHGEEWETLCNSRRTTHPPSHKTPSFHLVYNVTWVSCQKNLKALN